MNILVCHECYQELQHNRIQVIQCLKMQAFQVGSNVQVPTLNAHDQVLINGMLQEPHIEALQILQCLIIKFQCLQLYHFVFQGHLTQTMVNKNQLKHHFKIQNQGIHVFIKRPMLFRKALSKQQNKGQKIWLQPQTGFKLLVLRLNNKKTKAKKFLFPSSQNILSSKTKKSTKPTRTW